MEASPRGQPVGGGSDNHHRRRGDVIGQCRRDRRGGAGQFAADRSGLLISIPLIVFGSQLVLKYLLRFPLLVTLGGGLLGWIAGDIISGDAALWDGSRGSRYAGNARQAAARGPGDGDRYNPGAPVAARPKEVVDLAAEEQMTDTLRVLVPMDDSPSALRAVRHVIELAGRGLAVEVHLLNVQAPVRGSAAALIAQRELNDYHREEGMKALAGAQTLVERAGLPMHLHVGVGDAGETRWRSRGDWIAGRSSWARADWAASRG